MDLIPSNSSWSSSHEVSLFVSGENLQLVGTIISSYLILTLASFLYGNGQNKVTIRTKGVNRENSNSKLDEAQIRNISQIILHPEFKNSSTENDLAILVLAQDLDVTVNSGVQILPILDQSTSMNFSGCLCKGQLVLSSFEISEPSRCASSSSGLESDQLCLLPVKSNSKSSETNCKSPFRGSSLICSDAERGPFLCGILASSPEEVGENGKIYTNVSSYSKWIQSASDTAKSQDPSNSDDDADYSVGALDIADVAKNTESEQESPVEPHILNGIGSGPISYQLSLRMYGSPPNDDEWEHICGAVIVDETTAVTAAHCFKNSKDASRYRVVAGEDRLNANDTKEQVLSLKNIIIHPDYTNVTNGSDIAVLHMENFKFNKYARPVWLSRFSSEELANKTAVISGWGQVSNDPVAANVLQKASVSILPPDNCQMRVEQRWNFTARKGILCTLNRKTRTCRGDSGGPLVIPNYSLGNSVGDLLVGIVSVGATVCELKNTAGGFTEISHFYDWIQEKRAENPCKDNNFPCITGGCYHKDVKCDKEADCLDGTDEMNCQATLETATTTPCGGFINLDREHELVYKVPSENRQRDSICLWIISTGRQDADASIKATILDDPLAQFNPSSDIIYADYNYTVSNSFYIPMNQVGTKYTVGGPFMALYYRTNSSASNAGFHLKLKDSVTANNMMKRLDAKLITIPNADIKTGEIREFSYPSSSGASNYASNERTFFTLKPQKSGAKIRVNLKFMDTEEKHDWLQINSYRIVSFRLTRFSGRSDWKELILDGLEDQPIVFYFHSDKSREGEGFKIQYSEIMAPKPAGCGGLIRFDREHEMLYKVPSELRGEKSICVWVVEAPHASSIEFEVISNPKAHFQLPESTLFAIYNFTINDTSYWNIWNKDQKYLIQQPFLVLHFSTNSSAPNSGFHIHLREAGRREAQMPVKYLELTNQDGAASSTQIFKYPQPPASNYMNDERTFIIVKPGTRHGKLKFNLTSVNTEENHDWLDVVEMESIPISFRSNGESSWSDKFFWAEEDEPFFIYFHSDRALTKAGFQFSYSEQRKTGITTLVDPPSISSCSEAMKILPTPLSAKQLIYPFGETGGNNNNNKSLPVLCDFQVDGGGWTVIQKRGSGPKEEFYKEWADYVSGFGSLDGNFWLGLEHIRALTKNGDQELRIELEDFGGAKAFAKYSSFSISDASDFYRLSIGGFSGDSTAGDSITSSYGLNGIRFSTRDKDNDGDPSEIKNCAKTRQGAWWYKSQDWSCAHSNLNGYYYQPNESFPQGHGLVWESWRGPTTPLKKSEMKIRKKN